MRFSFLLKPATAVAAFVAFSNTSPAAKSPDASDQFLSPCALATSTNTPWIAVACATGNRVALVHTESNNIVRWVNVPSAPLGLAINRAATKLYIACAGTEGPGTVLEASLSNGTILRVLPAGHTPMSPVLSGDEQRLYVCNRFDNDVSVLDLRTGRCSSRIGVEREPVAAALTPDGKKLVVVNHLQSGAVNDAAAVAKVSFIDLGSEKVAKQTRLPFGASMARGIAISPDGRFAAVTHIRAMHWLTTKAVDMGQMNSSAVTFLDVAKAELLGTVLLDQTAQGSANPWSVAWSPDGKTLAVSCAGAQEICFLNAPVTADRSSFFPLQISEYDSDGAKQVRPPAHPVRVRARVACGGEGPRALAFSGSRLYVANYFSDDITWADLEDMEAGFSTVILGNSPVPSLARRGEMYFNDARLCYQRWQSCASCHDDDARTDALNWDLLNDGKGNPKNTRSLLYAHHSGPVMALGVRADAGAAVRAGIHHILFTDPPDEVPAALDAYVKSLRPVLSPKLTNGTLSAAAFRGRKLFENSETRCAVCHNGPLLSDLKTHDVGTRSQYHGMWDGNGQDASPKFTTPVLRELWRTAPYLHDGSAPTMDTVLKQKNLKDQHGRTSHLTEAELTDLAQYLLSL